MQKLDNMSQYSKNQEQFIDFTQYVDYQDHNFNNLKTHSVHPGYKTELYSDCYGQNNKTTMNNNKNRQNVISENNASSYILCNMQRKGRHDWNVGCRSRYSRRREQKVHSIQYSESNKDKLENTKQYADRQEQMIRSSHYQRGHNRQTTHTNIYHYSVCREHAKNKFSHRKVAESGKTVT